MARNNRHKNDGIGDWFQNNDAGRVIGQLTGASAWQAGFEAQGRGQINGARRTGYRIGQQQGSVQTYQALGGAQSAYDYGAMRGANRAASRMGYADGQNAVYNSGYNSGGQYGGQHAPRYNDNGRYGQPQYRDDIPNAPSGQHPQSRSFEPAEQDRFTVSDGKFTYQIDNGGVPLTREQQQKIGMALADIQSWGGKDEAGALRFALQNGLSPDAIIVSSSGRAKSGVDVETFVKQGMMGGDQKTALAMLDQAERNPTAFYNPQPQSFARDTAGVANDGFAIPQSQSIMTNLLRDTSIAPEQRVQQLREYIKDIDTRAEAQQFHRELAGNPNLITEYGSLLEKAGISGADKTREIETVIAEQGRINRLDPEGAQRAAQSMAGTSAYAQSYNSYTNSPTTAELSQVTIEGNDELAKRFQDAVAKQKGWDDMAKSNPIAGMFMMLLRPFINAMNPDSDPTRILAEAQNTPGVTINAPDAVKTKLASALGRDDNLAVATAAPAPNLQEMTANAPPQEKAEQDAAQVKAAAERDAAGKPQSALSADNGEDRDTAPTLADAKSTAQQPVVPQPALTDLQKEVQAFERELTRDGRRMTNEDGTLSTEEIAAIDRSFSGRHDQAQIEHNPKGDVAQRYDQFQHLKEKLAEAGLTTQARGGEHIADGTQVDAKAGAGQVQREQAGPAV